VAVHVRVVGSVALVEPYRTGALLLLPAVVERAEALVSKVSASGRRLLRALAGGAAPTRMALVLRCAMQEKLDVLGGSVARVYDPVLMPLRVPSSSSKGGAVLICTKLLLVLPRGA
jgi:hypothetical protein